MDQCPFCVKMARLSALPAEELIWEFPYSVALLGAWQYYAGYCVLVSRSHATDLTKLNEYERRGYLNEMCILSQAIETVFKPRKMNYELLGNQVAHPHWHLFPRPADDPDPLRPVWFALERAQQEPAERQRLQTGPQSPTEMAERLRQQLSLMTGKPI